MKFFKSKIGWISVILYLLIVTYFYFVSLNCSGFLCGVGFYPVSVPWLYLSIPLQNISFVNDTIILYGGILANIVLLYSLGFLIELRFPAKNIFIVLCDILVVAVILYILIYLTYHFSGAAYL